MVKVHIHIDRSGGSTRDKLLSYEKICETRKDQDDTCRKASDGSRDRDRETTQRVNRRKKVIIKKFGPRESRPTAHIHEVMRLCPQVQI
jgi:hypothetical protein